MHRIPPHAKKKTRKLKNRGPVYMVHGLLGNSDSWLVAGVGKAISYLLADAGYDVWMANTRGNMHSRRHEILSPNTNAFWDFTWHEVGIYDNPSNIDYILEKTNQTKLHYIGHSQGTTAFFVMASMRPEYNAKMKTVHNLSPVVFMSHLISPLFRIPALIPNLISIFADTLGFREYLPDMWIVEKLSQKFCKNQFPVTNLCANVMFLLGGFNSEQLNITLVPDMFAVSPAGGSLYQLIHYLQEINSGRFQMFDRGKVINLLKYGQKTPPDYPLEKVSAPLYLYYSTNDWLAAVEDVRILQSKLKSVVESILIADPKWTHLDYIWGIDAKKLVFDLVISRMNAYERNSTKLKKRRD